jgi:hypothetical protein
LVRGETNPSNNGSYAASPRPWRFRFPTVLRGLAKGSRTRATPPTAHVSAGSGGARKRGPTASRRPVRSSSTSRPCWEANWRPRRHFLCSRLQPSWRRAVRAQPHLGYPKPHCPEGGSVSGGRGEVGGCGTDPPPRHFSPPGGWGCMKRPALALEIKCFQGQRPRCAVP